VVKKKLPTRRAKASPEPIFRTKLTRPNLAAGILARPRLMESLAAHADRPLSLVVADAGYGKTTLLASFSSSLGRPVVWYSLMPSDADGVVFGGHLLQGFRQEFPRFGRDFERALAESRGGGAAMQRLGVLLAHALAERKGPPCLLVLDDFHEVAGNATITGMVNALLRHLPPGARLLIGSRSTPPLALDRMRARGELFELDSSHLRYTRDEMKRLFHEVYGMPLADSELEPLEAITLGWPTAVHLVHESLRRSPGHPLDAVLAEFHGSSLALHDYLSSEIYARLEADERLVLERVAALNRFDTGLAADLSGLRDPQPVMRRLAHRGLLRSFGSAEGTTWEVHDLVRRFVRRHLESEKGAACLAELEAETARALAGRGETERALRHWLIAGRNAEAAELLARLAPPLLRQGRAATLLQYLTDLPEALTRSDPTLLVTLADCREQLGQWDAAEPLYREALVRCAAEGLKSLECSALLGLSKVLNMRGQHDHVLAMAERGLAMSGGLDPEKRVRLLQRKAGAHFYLGQYQAAVRILGEVRAALPSGSDPELLLPTLHNMAMAYAAAGRFREASREFGAALAQVRGGASPRAPLYLSNLSFLLAELGELPEARAAAEEGLAAALRFSNRPQEITCREALAQVLALSGDLDGALAELRHAEELNREQRMDLIAGDLLALRGRIFCARGQYRRAVEFVQEAIARLGERPDQPRLTEYRATLAWCELRAGRARVARDLLLELVKRADGEENEFQRMRVRYWLAEALLALGETQGVDAHLEVSLRLVREHGYAYFAGVQAREEPAPMLRALARGIELDVASAALVEAGPRVEPELLELVTSAPVSASEAAIAVLGEVGGSLALDRLRTLKGKRALQAATRVAVRHLEERVRRGAPAAAEGAAPRARLVLFGPPRLEVDGRLVPASAWRSQRSFQILVYLALHPRGVVRDQLLETFWPGRQLAAGKRNFHPTLSYLRKVLPAAPAAPLRREGEYYRLDSEYPLTCDAWELDHALEAARNAKGAEARLEALERAVLLGAHPFLEGLYGDWADEQQSRMRDRMERVLLQAAEACAAAGDHERALLHFRRAAELDPYRESTRVSVIECLVQLGNRRAALVEVDRMRTMLRDELGVEPVTETEARLERLLGPGRETGPAARTRATPEPAGAQAAKPSTQVPIKALR
jgi:ATP/maltotriose-dependent transcriptional regulator MalT/DNA-binding SARP family transcriptional activator